MHLDKAFLWGGQACSKGSRLTEHRYLGGRRSQVSFSPFLTNYLKVLLDPFLLQKSTAIVSNYFHSHLWLRKCLPFLLGTNFYTYMNPLLPQNTARHYLKITFNSGSADYSWFLPVDTWVTYAFCELFRLCRCKSRKSFDFRRATWLLSRAALIPICETSSEF